MAMLAANLAPDWYHSGRSRARPFGEVALFGHPLTVHFLVNDVFMVFFFGIAAKEITESCLPGGALNPPSQGGQPAAGHTRWRDRARSLVFFVGLQLALLDQGSTSRLCTTTTQLLARGWGVPTATDIALAWLVARTVFGKGHPAVNFLLLLAVADDAIGLVIIAVFYGDPVHPARNRAFLGLVLARHGPGLLAAAPGRQPVAALHRSGGAVGLERA